MQLTIAAVTVVFAEGPVRRIVRPLRKAAGGCLGHFFTFCFGCRRLADRPFAKVLILSRTRLESALVSPSGTKESCVSQDFGDRICRVRY